VPAPTLQELALDLMTTLQLPTDAADMNSEKIFEASSAWNTPVSGQPEMGNFPRTELGSITNTYETELLGKLPKHTLFMR
jgi:hypothetical protein